MADMKMVAEIKSLSANDVLTVETHFTKQFHIRLWVGLELIRLASWVMGCSVRFEDRWP